MLGFLPEKHFVYMFNSVNEADVCKEHWFLPKRKKHAPGEDRTHDLQITLWSHDYETDALPTALPRRWKYNVLTFLASHIRI